MLDDRGQFVGTAAKELQEETGITVCTSELVDLVQSVSNSSGHRYPGIYMSPGGCDEYIKMYYCEKKMSMKEIDDVHNRLGGEGDHEKIRCRIIAESDLLTTVADAKALCCYALLDKIRSK
ncbi:hypothetical protein GEMRC1_007509 [Eukaryota sp. GEM-RC1]